MCCLKVKSVVPVAEQSDMLAVLNIVARHVGSVATVSCHDVYPESRMFKKRCLTLVLVADDIPICSGIAMAQHWLMSCQCW